MPSVTFNASGSWTAPPDIAGPPQVKVWGESGTGGTAAHGSHAGGGSGAGAYAEEPTYAGVTAGTVINFTVGTGGTGTDTVVTGGTGSITAAHGTSAAGQTQGTGGAAGSATIAHKGGDGAIGAGGASQNGSGGGGSGGASGDGGNASGATGGTAGSGGGQAGASGAGSNADGAAGATPGGGASGGGSAGSLNHAGGAAAPGQVTITWTVISYAATGYASVTARTGTGRKAISGAKGYLSFTGAPLPVRAVNQWSATFAQPASFQTTPPALQSAVVALTPGNSVGGGSGTPTAGNWLFCLVGLNEQSAASGFTIGDSDDIHSFWRPAVLAAAETPSDDFSAVPGVAIPGASVPGSTGMAGVAAPAAVSVSTATGKTRTSVWYTANLARTASDVYTAPNGCMAGMAVLVIEVAGLGPWDTVTGVGTNYAAAATSLNLALPAPPAPACIIAAFTGDSTAATQAFAPGSPWQVLSTVSATNGTDHTCDAVLTSALLGTTSGSVSVTATAGSATDLSGVVIGMLCNAPSPVPAGANPAWPGRFIVEAALGSGFETPADEMTWTTLNDNGVAPAQATKRLWSWHDGGGVPYALGQLQSGEGAVQLDNADGGLTPSNSASPYFPDVVTGTPIRLRCAIGTLADRNGNVTADRWYVVQRNILDIPEKRNDAWRNFVEMSLTDIWSVAAGSPPSPYRAEVLQDLQAALAAGSKGWWWPCDDQPLSGGVLPTSLRNAAPGSSAPLQIIAAPGGVVSQDAYSTTGVDITSQAPTYGDAAAPPGVATYAVGAQSGWMYGDPQSSPASSTAGGPVTASPGAAAWQQSGLLGNTGSAGWFLAANDTFPPIASGVTVEGWCSWPFFGTAQGSTVASTYVVAGQPACPLTIAELATGSAPVAVLQMDGTTGHLNLITYNGGSGTSHSIYTGSDLRCAAFFYWSVRLTQSTYEVKVNAGLTADVSGSATISASAWSWLIACGDLGTNGGSSAGTGLVHGGNAAYSHLAVYPGIMPAWRELARYCAAITGFGVIPAPSGMQLTSVINQTQGGGNTPDGTEFQGSYGLSGLTVGSYTVSATAVSVAGSYHSGPAARAVAAGTGKVSVSPHIGAAVWTGWSALAPLVQVFTSASAGAETEAAACLGAGDSFTAGYGAGASGAGVCQVSGGTGASPPSGPSALGDTVAQRIERILGSAGITAPNRSIDATANAAVQAALDTGGAAAGSSVQSVQTSDDGLLAVDNGGALMYRSRPHLNTDPVVWYVSSAGLQYGYPFKPDQQFIADPQRVWNAIEVVPYSPDGSTLPAVTPASATAVAASQAQYGPRPLSVTSYLQSETSQQTQANWLLSTFGANERRVPTLTVDASGYPPAWLMVLGANVGDRIQITDQPLLGGPMSVGTYRISSLSRKIAFGANSNKPQASITLVIDPDVTFWT